MIKWYSAITWAISKSIVNVILYYLPILSCTDTQVKFEKIGRVSCINNTQ